jgi:AhpD family alkylhydroperoxidase
MNNRLPVETPNPAAPSIDGPAEIKLLELVSLRVAQIHHCAESIQYHSRKLKAEGETPTRLAHLGDWEACDLFDRQERAALRLCEKITLDPAQPHPDFLIQEMRHYFTKAEILSLTLAIMAVNDWNSWDGNPIYPQRK